MQEEREYRKISISEFKKLLGPLAERLTEQQINELRDKGYKFADAIFDWWVRKRNRAASGDSRDLAR